MKRFFISSLLLVLILGFAFAENSRGALHTTSQMLAGIPASELDGDEREGLLLMREEEKLARDVYAELFSAWDVRVFSNIGSAEQTHMDSVAELLDRYDIADPVTNDRQGAFTNTDLEDLYTSLVDQGGESVVDALRVGALIEELDIADLNTLIAQTDNEDLRLVYENLLAGSHNHLQAFVSQLDRYGESYEPTYLEVSEMNSILEDQDFRMGTRQGSRGLGRNGR